MLHFQVLIAWMECMQLQLVGFTPFIAGAVNMQQSYIIVFCFSSPTEECISRYEALLTHIKHRLNQLQGAYASSQTLRGSLTDIERWLDEAERNVHKMVKGTVIMAKKEPLQENVNEQMVGVLAISFDECMFIKK